VRSRGVGSTLGELLDDARRRSFVGRAEELTTFREIVAKGLDLVTDILWAVEIGQRRLG
jgi:hypothetical protein